MKRFLVTLVAAVMLVVSASAQADVVARTDPDDTSGALDIGSVGHDHRFAFGRNKLVHTISTFETWELSDVNHNDSLQIEFQLPGRNRTNPPERLLVINVKDGALKAKLYSTVGDPPKFLANIALACPSADSVRVTFGKHLLRKGLKTYRYRVFTYFEKSGSSCRRPEACQDDAPDARASGVPRWIRHDL